MKYLVNRLRAARWRHTLLAALGGLFLMMAAQAQEIDEVVLIVDDLAVTENEYNVLHFIQTQADTFAQVAPELGNDATETIIDDLLLTAHAKRLAPDAVISEAQIDQAIQGLAGRNQLTAEQLLSQLRNQGVDTKIFKSGIGQRLLVQQVIGQRIAGSVNVSPTEIKEYIDNRPELRDQAKKTYRASHLVVSVEEGLSKREVKALANLAEDVRARLQAGEEMGTLVEEYDTVSVSGNNGDLGWKKQEDLPELFVSALDALQVGGVSAVLESSNGFHLLVLTDVKSSSSAPQEYHVRHIAKALPAEADGREQASQLRNVKFQILAGLDFAAIARTQSDDAGSASGGGDLGWIRLEQIDPAFAQAILTLEVGLISDPVRSSYGLHLIQLLQVRNVQGASTLESQVQQRIFSEKLDEQMQDLLNDLKQSALIEVVKS